MVSKDSIETAYSFFHQKQRVYQYSTMDWQKDDIEYATADYVDSMSTELYDMISAGKPDFLKDHSTFGKEILDAVNLLENHLNDK